MGRNLTVESQLDTAKGSNSSKGANAGVTVGLGGEGLNLGVNAGANMAKGWQSRAWVDNPSGILTDDELNVSVGENTSLTGGVIASRSDDLTLETETLETKDFELHDKNRQVSASANVSLGRSADGNFTPGGSIEGSYSNYEKEGIARATIGEGEIVVRDGDADRRAKTGLHCISRICLASSRRSGGAFWKSSEKPSSSDRCGLKRIASMSSWRRLSFS